MKGWCDAAAGDILDMVSLCGRLDHRALSRDGGDAFSNPTMEPELVVALGWDPMPGWSIGSNVGSLGGELGAGADNQWIGSLVVGRAVSDGIAVFAEGYGFSGGTGEAEAFVDAGLTLAVGHDFQLDLRVAKQVRGSASERHFGVGVARRWRLLL